MCLATRQTSPTSRRMKTKHVIAATLISEPVHPPLASLTNPRGKVWLKQRARKSQTNTKNPTLRNQKDYYLGVQHVFTLPYICGGSVCTHTCVFWCTIAGGTDGICTLRQAACECPWQSRRRHENTTFHRCLWWGYHFLPQISWEEKKTCSFITNDHTTHLTILLHWQFILRQLLVMQTH